MDISAMDSSRFVNCVNGLNVGRLVTDLVDPLRTFYGSCCVEVVARFSNLRYLAARLWRLPIRDFLYMTGDCCSWSDTSSVWDRK